MLNEHVQTETVILTPAATQAVRELLQKRSLEGYALRVFIQGGGCSGFQYGMALDGNMREDDLAWDYDGVKLIVDPVSIEYLNGATVDYVDDLMGSGFKIENPNAISSCGCGSSFRTKDSAESGCEDGSCGCH